MMIFLSFMVMLLFILNCFISNIIVWWSSFLLMTIMFILINKVNLSFSSLMNYFIIQETAGMLFLLLNFTMLQFLVILLKIGVAPLHFWIFSITNNLYGQGVIWFLTFQKLPFFPIILYLLQNSYLYLFIIGIMFCYFQLFSLKNYKNMLVLSSTESFNWIILISISSFFSSLMFFLYYFFIMIFMLDYNNKKDSSFYNWETVLVFMNLPLSITFFIKIFSLISVFQYNSFIVLLILFLMFLSMLSFGFWLVNISTKFYFEQLNNKVSYYFIIFPLMFLCLF
nr:NADH dehydrogenase subunit 2 [Rhabditophanes sp. KR3021]